MKNIFYQLMLGLSVILTSLSCYSQGEEDFFWDISVQVASTEIENIFNAPSTVSIINREMIENYNFLSIAEAIQTVSGIAVTRTYLKRNLPTSRGVLQDNYANKVLILINGVPSWNSVTGEGNLDRIDIDDVERIEVLKGPASVLYGTNAYSGAVNIVLRSSEDKKLNSHMGFGTNGSYQAGANFSAKQGDLTYFVAANTSNIIHKKVEFVDESKYTGLLNEFIQSDNFTFETKYKGHSLLFNGYHGQESYLGVVPTFAAGAGNPHELKGYLINYGYDRAISDKFTLRFGLNYDYGLRNLSRTKDDVIRANVEGYRINGYASGGYQISNAFHIELGATYEQRKSIEYANYDVLQDTLVPSKWTSIVNGDTNYVILDGTNGMSDLQLHEFSVFGQLKFVKNSFRAVVGARYTNNELFGDNISSRASFSYAINEKNSIKLMYGESFRSPSFFEQYFVNNTVLGNKDLAPEKSKSIELAYLTGVKELFVQVLGYYGIYENAIIRQKGSAEPFEGFEVQNISIYQNGNTFNATGIELEVNYLNPKIINSFLNLDYVMGNDGDIDETESYNFKYVPKMSVTLGLSKNIGKHFGLSGMMNYWSETTGPIKDASGEFTKIDPQMILDLNLFYKHELAGAKIRQSLSAKNLLDENIMVPEYVRRSKLNEISNGYYRTITYTVAVSL